MPPRIGGAAADLISGSSNWDPGGRAADSLNPKDHAGFGGLKPLKVKQKLLSMNLIKFWVLSNLLQHIILIKVLARLPGNETDHLALLNFKAKITDDPLEITRSWNQSVHFCHWPGVTCGGAQPQRVTVLDLNSQKLSGSISPHIGNLSFLKVLNLQNNSFAQQIPPELGNLRRLQILRLNNNSITGQVPVNLSACHELVRINLANNKLSGNIPHQLGLLSKLEVIFLDKNSFTGSIPSSFGNLSSLNSLRASYNNIGGRIPKTLGQLKNLSFIGLGYNRLSGTIPAAIFNLSSIRELHVSYNEIEGSLPVNLGVDLPNLKTLGISFNRLTGRIPASLTNKSNLVNIVASGNRLSGKLPALGEMPKLHHLIMSFNNLGTGGAEDSDFFSSLTNATSLEELSVNGNNLGGVLPDSISNFSTRLWRLNLADNLMFGGIPTGIGNLINLETINMQGNKFSGNIPSDIGELHKLKILSIYDNQLQGSIPDSLGNLSMLIDFNLGTNNLQGSIPLSLAQCQSLLRLSLAQNKLSGALPKEVFGIATLIVLSLSHNNLTGSLPMEVGNLINLEELDVFENKLSGQIPSTLGSCVRLQTLYIQGNFFQGTIPSSLSSLRGIQFLDLSRNNLTGEVPNFLGDFMFLQTLNLSFNDFDGVVPTQGVFKNTSVISVLGNNKLCGGVPELHLPTCNSKGSEKRGLSHTAKMVIIFTVPILTGLCLFLLLFSWFQRRKISPSSTSQEHSHLKVSYQSLLKITDKFSSTNLIGSGSFGSVYKGTLDCDQNGSVVAVKVLNHLHPGASKSFIAECGALKNIRHRNLVKLLTVCSSIDYERNEFKALVYEFMINGSLEKWLHSDVEANEEPVRKLNLLQRLNIAIDVACAMNYLHRDCRTQIVHCDLKPSNVLLDGEMTAHVGDFGLARFFPQATASFPTNIQTSSMGIRGSVGYAAPEYGMGSEVSTYGDVYSYGILLLEIFTGKRPTDEMFKDNLNLHNFTKLAMPEKVVEIADPTLFEQDGEWEICGERIQECLFCIFRIGIACSVEAPKERLNMSSVVAELHLIKNILLGTGATTFAP